MEEIWKDVVGYEGLYSVSNLGNVRRDISGKGHCKAGRILRPFINNQGYYRHTLCKEGKCRNFMTSNLVAESFIGDIPINHEVNHKDGNKSNNRSDNFEYLTHAENIRHAFKNGLAKGRKGSCHPISKLTEKQVIEIRNKYIPRKYSLRRLGEEYNVDNTTISHIVLRQQWNHI